MEYYIQISVAETKITDFKWKDPKLSKIVIDDHLNRGHTSAFRDVTLATRMYATSVIISYIHFRGCVIQCV